MTTGEGLPAEARQGRIRSYVNAQEFVWVANVSEKFGVSGLTARADLTVVEEQGRLRRVHGGAVRRGLHLPEAESNRRMLGAARRRVVLAGGRKLGVVELARVCDIDQVDTLITDAFADDGAVARIREVGVDVTVVPVPAA